VTEDRACNYQTLSCITKTLTDFESIDACVDIDAICTEYSQHSHVYVVQDANVKGFADYFSYEVRQQYVSHTIVGDQNRQNTEKRQNDLISPRNVKHVIDETEQYAEYDAYQC
jgi:hypothetical protein